MKPVVQQIGILGGGQLGRMMARAGQCLEKQFAFYDTSNNKSLSLLGQVFTDKNNSVTQLADFAGVVTYESENTSLEQVRAIAKIIPVFPAEKSLSISQNRGLEKDLFKKLNIPCANYQLVNSLTELHSAVNEIGLPAILKTTTEGYDGKGQFVIKNQSQIEQAWQAIGHKELILESFIDFSRELSIIAVRNEQNEHVYYPLVQNIHHEGILRYTIAPAQQIIDSVQEVAENYMKQLLDELNHVGVLSLEVFETDEGLIVNEIAPRVHNSGHWTMDGAQTSQFENHLRAITGMPLGSTMPKQNFAAMVNIIGKTGDIKSVQNMLNTYLHLYNKEERAGRKLGHINILANSAEELFKMIKQLDGFLP